MQEHKNRVEAILFTTGKHMTLQEIANLCGIGSEEYVKEILELLQKNYEERGGALCLLNENNAWKLDIRKKYNFLTANLLSNAELDNSTIKTLAMITYRQPVLQSDIIKMRGNGAYDHINILKERGFITSEKKGRTNLLRLGEKFYDYFDIIEDELKEKLTKVEDSALQMPIRANKDET